MDFEIILGVPGNSHSIWSAVDPTSNSETKNTNFHLEYPAHVIEQPIFQIPNLEYLQRNFCFDFFNDSENTSWGFFEI